jgi:hypothetical protein
MFEKFTIVPTRRPTATARVVNWRVSAFSSFSGRGSVSVSVWTAVGAVRLFISTSVSGGVKWKGEEGELEGIDVSDSISFPFLFVLSYISNL